MDNKKENLILQKLIEKFGFEQVCEAIREIAPAAIALPVAIENTTSQEYLFNDMEKTTDQMLAELDEFFEMPTEIAKTPSGNDAKTISPATQTTWEEYKPLITHQQLNPANAA